jgi:hypothetical protein
MTAASHTSRSLVPSARATLRFRRLFAALGVCLPVPICAASGLSLPLPATVERIAAALVPFTDAVAMSANEALRAGASGSIVTEAKERWGARTPALTAELATRSANGKSRVRVVVPRPAITSKSTRSDAAPVAFTPSTEFGSRLGARDASARPPAAQQLGAGGQPQPAGRAEPEPGLSPVTEKPAPEPAATTTPTQPEPAVPPRRNEPEPVAPVKEVVSEVTAPVAPVVETTTTTVNETLAPVKETVAPVTELLPGLGK